MNDDRTHTKPKVLAGNLTDSECRLELLPDLTEIVLAPDDSVVVHLPQNEQVEISIAYKVGGMLLAVGGTTSE